MFIAPTDRNARSLAEHSVIVPMLQSLRRPVAGLTAVHQQHGELVMGRFFGKRMLFVCDPDYIEQVFNLEGRGLLSRDYLHDAKKPLFANGLINSPTAIWSKQRRLMQPFLSKEAVKRWEQVVVDNAEAVADRLQACSPSEIDLSRELKNLIQRIFIRILLGLSVDDIPQRAELLQAIDAISRELLPQLVSEILFGRHKRWLPINNRRYHQAIDYLKQFVLQQIDGKYANPGDDLISQFLQASDRDTGYQMPRALLQDEAISLFFAGQDTTINTLLWFFYRVGQHREIAERITAELEQLPNRALNANDLQHLSYTKATLYETLRLYPPTTALATQALQDIELGEYRIPQGTPILLSMYATHHNPRLWPEPEQFRPERFLDQANNPRHRFAFFPFGGGLHNCIGRHFAELELMLVIASLMRRLRFETLVEVQEAVGITLKPNRPIVSRVSARS